MSMLFNIQSFKYWRNNKHKLVIAPDRCTYEVLEVLFDQSVEFEKLFFSMYTGDQQRLMEKIQDTINTNIEKYRYRKEGV